MKRYITFVVLAFGATGCLPSSGGDGGDTPPRADAGASTTDGGIDPTPSDAESPSADQGESDSSVMAPDALAADAAPPEPSCDDGLQNGQETDVDCGGECAPCAPGGRCITQSDCANVRCTDGLCASPSCDDGLLNGAETDLDCGGDCVVCAVGMACGAAEDCVEGVCVDAVCAAAACGDEVRNGTETDTDCGGECDGCVVDRVCETQADCADNNPCLDGTCTLSTCEDGLHAGAETDQDCGGPACAPCTPGARCAQGPDCASGVCEGEVCAPPSCDDGVHNGDELMADCGGDCERCDLAGLSCEEIDLIWPAEWAQIEDEVLAATNVVRLRGADCGVEGVFPATHAVEAEPLLRCAARRHSDDMGRRNFFAHVTPDGQTPGDRIDATGYRYRAYGENIYAGRRAAQSAVDAWEESDGHCRNMMSPNFTQLGIGYAHVPETRYRHFHTQKFGRPR